MPTLSRGRAFPRRLMSLVAGALAALLALPVLTAPAAAADPEYLSITKSVDRGVLAPGDTYTYDVRMTCSEASCLDAVLTDTLGEHAGHELLDVELLPSTPGLTFEPTWTSGGTTGSAAPAVVAADTRLDVAFTQETVSPTGRGIQAGQTFSLQLTLRVPTDLAPGTRSTHVNTATVTATNSAPATATAQVEVTVPVTVGVTPAKSWTPAEQAFDAGAPSTIRIGATNGANVPADALVLQEPAVAPEGVATLDAANPFTLVDLTSLSGVSVPTGCTTVRVDAYVQRAGAWTWVTGDGGLALPAGVDADAVGGLRVTCDGPVAVGDTLSLDLGVAQRATHRTTGADLSVATSSLTNTVQARVEVDGEDPATATATAPYRVSPARLGTEVVKDLSPARVSAGEPSVLSLVASQTSDVPVRELRVTDLDFFGTDPAFGGFDGAPTWPTGADGASVVYHLSDGSTPTVPFTAGAVPAAPAVGPGVHVTGFELVFTGEIAPSAEPARARVTVLTTETATGPARQLDNTATSRVEAANGNSAQDTDDARLTVVPASIEVTLAKTVRPGTGLRPGDTAVTELRTTLAVSSSYVTARDLVVTDAWDGAARTFWDAFDLTAIAPTQVPSGTTVEVRLQTVVGTWVTVRTEPAQADAWLLQLDAAALAAGLPGGTALSDVTGVELRLHDADGFEENTTVTPYVVTTARGTLRSGGALPQGTTTFRNAATADGSGTTGGGTPVQDADGDDDDTAVTPPPPGAGPVEVRKTWTQPTVAAQSGQQRTTRLAWRTATGASSVTLTDPAAATDPAGADPAGTLLDAFDLVRVQPVAYSSTPFTNGWYLRYDRVADVRLLLPDGAGGRTWQSVPAPAGGWTNGGGFVGYTLTPQQRADAWGVQLVLEENAAARAAARQPGAALDPYAPAVGTGVATSSVDRTVDLQWEIRQVRRTGGWVTDRATYDASGAGVVRNTVGVAAARADGTVTAQDHADITITGSTPLVRVDKTVSTADVAYVPRPGTVPADQWPARTFGLTAWNDSVARASYLRVTDPACSDVDVQQAACAVDDPTADPFTGSVDWLAPGGSESAFDRFDLTDVRFSATRPAEVDLAASTAWLLRYADGTYTSERTTVAALLAATPADLADVVAVSATFQGTDPAVTGGTITQGNRLRLDLDVRLRTHVRSTGEAQTLRAGESVEVENHLYARSYDPVLAPDVVAAGTDVADVRLTGGEINVGVGKTVSPAVVTAPTRDEPLTVRLTADNGTAPAGTLAPAQVRLQDDATTSPEFWDEFDLVALGAVTLPAGADQVQVDVHGPFGPDGADAWVTGTPGATPTLPVAEDAAGQVDGVRFVLSRADGGFFSDAVPAPGWSATAELQVRLRDVTRTAGDPVVLDGDRRAVTNTVVGQADRLNGEASQQRASAAVVDLFEGTHRLAVDKLANEGNRTAQVGHPVPWDLSFRNAGSGYLDVAELRDTLPSHLVWTGETAPVVTVPAGSGMADQVTVSVDGSDVVLTWPQDGRRLAPGERVGVRLVLELQPGLAAGERAVNTMTVRTAQTLEACTPLDGTRPVTDAWADDATTCGSADHVSPRPGSNLFAVKGVRGSQPGAATAEGQECTTRLEATGGEYFRTPCIARSLVGGQDDWVLRAQNAGTTSIDELTVFDPLAALGDRMIITGGDRGSAYRPQVVPGSLQVTAPAGAAVLTEVTTAPDVCVGTWAALEGQAVCEQSGESWAPADDATDWSAVTGLRVQVDLRPSAAGSLLSGQFVDVTFSTVNVLAGDDVADGVPAGAAADSVVAWNQFGVKYHDLGSPTWSKIAPAKMGVEVLTGPIEVRKVVDGPAAGFAPASFTADVVCTLDGDVVALGDAATLTLDDANGYVARVGGVPVGARCDVAESGEPGDHGETTRSGTVRLEVDAVAGADGAVPTAQVATITNTYAFGGLTVTKRVDSTATAGLEGPFAFALTCTAPATGAPVTFDGEPALAFTLADGETFTAPDATIPAGATCALVETDGRGADRVLLVGDGVVPTGPGAADVTVGADGAQVEVVNGFDAGVLEVRKVVDGAGAATWGAGASFGFSAVCTYDDRTVLDESFELVADGVRTFGPYPVGTSCRVLEVAAGGATSSVLAPADGAVTIEPATDEGDVPAAVVTATNTFDVTSVEVVKQVAGATTAPGATGPFTVELVCTWPVGGQDVPLDVPGGAQRTLRAPTALTASWPGLPVGVDCTVTETATGGAAQVAATVRVEGQEPVTTSGARVPVVGLAGTTAPGQAVVELVNTFTAPPTDDPTGTVGTGTGGAGTGAADDGGPLAVTGADALRAGLVALLLLAAGGLLVALRRRRA